ncbi:hypothetical protein CC2G_013742 [Coprinopsis cinerea AmutBmut pab1-1]|nr:hypothetical protein CC2G_013742 [Coprinopsis cinerea AmutBmut pab1-1]
MACFSELEVCEEALGRFPFDVAPCCARSKYSLPRSQGHASIAGQPHSGRCFQANQSGLVSSNPVSIAE